MAEFIARLKQRKLVQWALAYVAFAFALIQVLDVVAQRFGWPDQLEKILILALAVGFVIVLVLAWYHGERGAQRISSTEIVILTLLLAIGGGLLWRFERSSPSAATIANTPPAAAQPIAEIPAKSVAVLPFVNESGDRDQQYFSDGLSEDLITTLSQFAGLKVISRDSSFRFRNSTDGSATIGEKLGVAHLLEGSVQRAASEVRISAELVNASDGSTLWSQRYDRPYKDLFALQDDITKSVAEALKAKLFDRGGAVVQSDRPPSGNLAAWNAYLRGRFYDALIDPEDERRAIGFYEQAIALDPHYARAYASVSLTWTTLAGTFLSGEAQRQGFAKARTAVDQALQLDADAAIAHDARGLLLQWVDFDWSGAGAEYRRALELAPADSTPRSIVGRSLDTLGRAQQAIPMLQQAIATDPRNGGTWGWLGWSLAAAGQLDGAEQAARKAREFVPGSPFLAAGLVLIQIQRGENKAALISAQRIPGPWGGIALAFALQVGDDRSAADAALKNLIAKQADGAAYQVAEVYALRRDPDNVFKWLDRAWDTRDSGLGRLLTDPFILRYKGDPRFAAFCRKVGLPATTDAKAMP